VIIDTDKDYMFSGLDLNEETVAKYTQKMQRALTRRGNSAEKLLLKALADPDLSIGAKNYLAYLGLNLRTAKIWALEHFAGAALHRVIVSTGLLYGPAMVAALLRNKHLDRVTVEITLRSGDFNTGHMKPHEYYTSKIKFLDQLSDNLFKEVTSMVFAERKRLMISLEALASRARKAYDIDESVPDEWVERMFT